MAVGIEDSDIVDRESFDSLTAKDAIATLTVAAIAHELQKIHKGRFADRKTAVTYIVEMAKILQMSHKQFMLLHTVICRNTARNTAGAFLMAETNGEFKTGIGGILSDTESYTDNSFKTRALTIAFSETADAVVKAAKGKKPSVFPNYPDPAVQQRLEHLIEYGPAIH